MESVWKPNYLIGFYFSILLVLLLCVSTTPLLIRHGIAITDRFMIEEDVLETIMILVLFGISFLVMIRMINRLNSFRQTAERAVYEKSKLISRLAEAFRYIGRVNVEIQEIESVLGGVAFYPQSKNEFRALVDKLAREVVHEVMEVFYDEEKGLIRENVGADGSFVSSFEGRLLNPGHAIEAMWFIMDLGRRLDDPALMPDGWQDLEKPAFTVPEDIVLYELHVRDFSIRDETVPGADRGTFRAFTHADALGMRHLARLQRAGLSHVHLLPDVRLLEAQLLLRVGHLGVDDGHALGVSGRDDRPAHQQHAGLHHATGRFRELPHVSGPTR